MAAKNGRMAGQSSKGCVAYLAYGILTLDPELLRALRMGGWPGAGKPLAPGPPKVPLTAVGVLAGVRVPPPKASLRGAVAASGPDIFNQFLRVVRQLRLVWLAASAFPTLTRRSTRLIKDRSLPNPRTAPLSVLLVASTRTLRQGRVLPMQPALGQNDSASTSLGTWGC